MNYFLRFLAFCFFLISCTSQKNLSLTGKSHLKLLGEYDVPYNQSFNNTTIGGLSGIDYDNKHKLYYLISDDRSDINPSRFYTAKISISTKGIDSVVFVSVVNLLQPGGTVYPNSKQDPYHTPDPEAIRYNPKTNQLVWSSEGERIVRKNISVLEDPSVRIISTEGNYIDSFILPSNTHMQAVEKGPRQNGVFEGISFSDNYRKLFVSVEEPLYEDGPRAGLYDSSAWIRIIEFDVKSKKPLGEYAYKIDPVAYPPNPPGAFKINGVPDILAINNHQLLVIERSFSTGRLPCTIKVYLAELNGASDVMNTVSLKNGTFKSVEKRLILNMDDLGIFTDNIEGVTVGPKLSNGHSTLIFVSDNNFSKVQVTQLLLFEVQ
ncbi:MAG: esterase-like activity of phytase family protein [Flavisolibacter sp.]